MSANPTDSKNPISNLPPAVTEKAAKGMSPDQIYQYLAGRTVEAAAAVFSLEQLMAVRTKAEQIYAVVRHVGIMAATEIQRVAKPQIDAIAAEEAQLREKLAALQTRKAQYVPTGVHATRTPSANGGTRQKVGGTGQSNKERIAEYIAANPNATDAEVQKALYGDAATTKTGYIAQVRKGTA